MSNVFCQMTEEARLKKLHDFKIMDTDPEELFDKITDMAARLLNTPIALIELLPVSWTAT